MAVFWFSNQILAQVPYNSDSSYKYKKVRPKDIFDVLSNSFKRKVEIDTIDIKDFQDNDSSKATTFSLLPSLNYSLVTDWAFGGTLSGYYYLDKKNNTNLSTTDLLAIYTLNRQLIIKVNRTNEIEISIGIFTDDVTLKYLVLK